MGMTKRARRAGEKLARIVSLVRAPDRRSSVPAHLRKHRLHILWDLLRWRLRRGGVPALYFACGLDRRGTDIDVLVALQRLKATRRALNYLPTDWRRFNYTAVLRDKYLFTLFAQDRGHPVPQMLARFDADSLRWNGTSEVHVLEEIHNRAPVDGFAKPVVGIWGRGAFQLRVSDDELRINGRSATVDELRQRIDGGYILQERIVQHPHVAKLHPASINTLRLVTAMHQGTVQLIGSAMRIGVGGKPVDNWGSGGVIIGVDLDERCLRGRGVFRPGTGDPVLQHPDTYISLDGYPVPHIDEAIRVAMRFHADLPTIHSIGWDIALTPDGPLVIEANDHWNITIHVLVDDDGFIERFEQACSSLRR
jgi:hypothetical protein